jgi:hypothetical protein
MSSQTQIRRWAIVAVLAAGGFSGGFLLSNAAGLRRSPADSPRTPAVPKTGTQVLAIFAGAATCGASHYPELPGALATIRRVLTSKARADNDTFVSVGIAVDQDPWKGAEFLREFGPFDEILSGHGWLNTGALAFIVRDMPAQRAIPQLILVERDVQVEELSISTVHDRLVGRKIGADQIVEYAALLSGRATGETPETTAR